MRFEQYLSNIYNQIKNNDIFKETLNNNFIYRGNNSSNINEYQIFNVRKDRRPRDMPAELHYDLDDAFKKKFGWNVRSSGVFTTGDKIQTNDYGDPYIFIPLGSYKFVWCNKIKDLFMAYDNVFREIGMSKIDYEYLRYVINSNSPEEEKDDRYYDLIEDIVKLYTDKNIKKAILSKNEIVFSCNSYILFNEEYYKKLIRESF